jgi:flagellar basal-body rod modification protein FlgD
MSAITSASNVSGSDFVSGDNIGFAGLTADDFMKMLIAELQNQDPSEPVTNADLMSQLSMMRNLTASDELSTTLKTMTSNQVLADASSFIGKEIVGRTPEGDSVEGLVTKAFTESGETFLQVGTQSLKFADVQSVSTT